MEPAHTWYEPFAGSAPTALRLLHPRLRPFAPYTGSKRRWASAILAVAGMRAGDAPFVLLRDVGPWGRAWSFFGRTPGRAERVADVLDGWASQDGRALAERLAGTPPAAEHARAIAHWMWLQARSVNNLPVWWDALAGVWMMGDRPRNGGEKRWRQRGTWLAAPTRSSGCMDPGTLAHRLRLFACVAPVGRLHGSTVTGLSLAGLPERLDGWVCFLDPPYRGCTCYMRQVPRPRLVALARALVARGARVLIAEAEPLAELEGWHAVELAPGEVLTCSFAPLWRPPVQLVLTPALTIEDAQPAPRRKRTRAPAPPPPEPGPPQLTLF